MQNTTSQYAKMKHRNDIIALHLYNLALFVTELTPLHLDPPSFIYVMTERMDDWNQHESWKRITCIMMIHVGHQNKEITAAAQYSMNTVTTRHELENCDGDYEAVPRRK